MHTTEITSCQQESEANSYILSEGKFIARKSITFDNPARAFQVKAEPAELSLMLEVASLAKPDGTGCWAAQSTLASRTLLTVDTAGKWLRAARKDGRVTRTGAHATTGTDILSIKLPERLPARVSKVMFNVGFHYALKPLRRHVFLAHCEVADYDGQTWGRTPTEARLAKRFGADERSVRRARAWLVEKGLLRFVWRQSPGMPARFDVTLCDAGRALLAQYRERLAPKNEPDSSSKPLKNLNTEVANATDLLPVCQNKDTPDIFPENTGQKAEEHRTISGYKSKSFDQAPDQAPDARDARPVDRRDDLDRDLGDANATTNRAPSAKQAHQVKPQHRAPLALPAADIEAGEGRQWAASAATRWAAAARPSNDNRVDEDSFDGMCASRDRQISDLGFDPDEIRLEEMRKRVQGDPILPARMPRAAA